MFAVLRGGNLTNQPVVRISSDGGATWSTSIAGGLSANAVIVNSVHPPYNSNEDGNIIYFSWRDEQGGTFHYYVQKYEVGVGLTTVYHIGDPGGTVGRWGVESHTENIESVYYFDESCTEFHISDDGGATSTPASMNGISYGGLQVFSSGGFPTTDQQLYAVTGAGIYS